MAASKQKNSTLRPLHDVPLPATPDKVAKARKPRWGKGKEEVAGPGRVQAATASGGASEASTSANAVQDSPWPWVSITDSSASRHPAIFTKDGSYFFSIMGSSVKIYSSTTGQVVSTLSTSLRSASSSEGAAGHSDVITSALLNPQNIFQLITGSLDGCIKVWDFLDAVLLQTIDLGQPIYHLAAHEKIKDYLFVSVTRPNKKKSRAEKSAEDNGAVLRVSLKPTTATAQASVQKSSDIMGIGKTRLTHGLAISPSGSWLVAIGGHKAYVATTSNLKAGFTKFVSPEALTCLAFHPAEEYFATGDAKGNIRLWYCLDESVTAHVAAVEKRAPTTTLHWHSHAVSALAFTPNGAYLLSGGEESVLVIWQLHSGKKEFVPRIGAPIFSITHTRASTQEEEYLLGLADASFVFVNSGRLKISRAFSRIKLDPAISHSRPATSTSVPLAVHSLSSTLILPSSHPSSLQTYAPSSSRLLSELEVSPSNRVSRRDEKALEPSRVERVVISSSGEWMATIDSREGDDSFRGEVYLKIWWWDKISGSWILNTRVDRPHGLTKVTAVAFTPGACDHNSLLLVTSGEDGNIKSWRIRVSKEKKGTEEVFWVSRSTFTFREEIPGHVAWSADGSLLAVSLGPYVVLYDPVTNALLQVLATPECNHVVAAYFLGATSRYLAVVGKLDIALWDLITQTLQWHYHSPLPIDTIVPHPQKEMMALFQQQPTYSNSESHSTRVLIFDPSSATPRKAYTVPFGLRTVTWYSQSPPQSSQDSLFRLVGITDMWSVVLFGDDIRAPLEEGASAKGIVDGAADPQKRTLFQDIFGKSAFADLSIDSSSPPSQARGQHWSGKDVANVFDAPAYLMPPIGTLFDSVMSNFLKPRPAEIESIADEVQGENDEDIDMETDGEDADRPILVGERLDRFVDWREMNILIEVFREHAIKSPAPPATSIPRPHVNGNGLHKTSSSVMVNTASKSNGAPRPEIPVGYPSPDSSPSSESSSPAMLGQKRKKS